jgi:regulator of sigma E protease
LAGPTKPNSPIAEKSGIVVGDVITSINGREVHDMFEVRNIINSQRDNKELKITVNRNDTQQNLSVVPSKITMKNGEVILRIGVVGSEESIHYGAIESIQNAAIKIYVLNAFMVDGLFKMLSGNGNKEDVGGPIKIAKITGEAAKGGMQSFLGLLVLLSLNLGLLNLLPIPGLDGGHLMYYLINAVIGKPLPQRVQTVGIKIGFILLISLMIFVTINDILSL